MTTELPRYYPRFSQPGDLDKLLKFYDINPHADIKERHREVFEKMINDGNVVLIEDKAGNIVAGSITYPFISKDALGNENTKWDEIGTLRCTLSGYGLMDAVVSLQTLRTFMVAPPSDRFVAHMESEPVRKMARKLGFREFTPVKEVFNLRAAMIPNYKGSPNYYVNWYQSGIEAMPVMARAVVQLFDNPVLENAKTHEKIVLDFSRSDFCKTLEPAIRKLATANLGDVDKPDFSKGVKKEQEELLRKFFL